MKHPESNPKRFTVWLLAIVVTCLVQAPLASVQPIPDSKETSAWSADEISQFDTASPLAAADGAAQLQLAGAYGRAANALDRLPLHFEEIQEGTANGSRFIAQAAGLDFSIAPTEVVMRLPAGQRSAAPVRDVTHGCIAGVRDSDAAPASPTQRQTVSLRVQFVGANRRARVTGENQVTSRTNYFIGGDPKKWRTNVPTYSRVEYESVYRGVDLVYYGGQQQLEYDFIVAPGASYRAVRIRFEGADRVSLNDDGDLVIEIGGRTVHHRGPAVYQEVNGIKETVAGRYIVRGRREVGFEIGDYDANRSLVIDPVFSYSTYLGNAPISSVAVDANGSAYVAGSVSLGAFGRFDAFVMKLNPEGTAVLYSTFLGGSDRLITEGIQNQAFDIAVDSNGNAYVTGSTGSKDFPTTPGAFQKTLPGTSSGISSAFVTKLNSTGDALVYSTYLGGTDNSSSSGQAIAVDEAGSAYVTGSTSSFKFPLVNPVQSTNRSGICASGDTLFFCQSEAFVTKLNPFGSSLIYSTYLGGAGDDSGSDIAVDGAGSAHVVGTTSASNVSATSAPGFPTKNPLQPARSGSTDLFIAKLSAAGNEFIYSTFLGGTGRDSANGVAVDSSGNAYVTGRTSSTDFPTTPGALQGANASSTAFKSTDGGTTWISINRGLPGTDRAVQQLVFDPISASTLYAATDGGVFKSTDAGNSWRLLTFDSINTLAIDPANSSTLYAGLSSLFGRGLQKSTDGGKTWFRADAGIAPNLPLSILIDPKDPSTLYVAAALLIEGGQSAGIFKSTDAGIRWFSSSRGISQPQVRALALAPAKPKILYALSGGSIFKSTNRGRKWKPGGFFGAVSADSLAVDPLNPNTIYLGTPAGVSKSTDGAETWQSTTIHEGIGLLVVDPQNPSTIYAAGRDATNADRNFKSTDAGASWKALGRISGNFAATFAIDPHNTSIVYAGTLAASPFNLSADAFVAKINPTGTALIYSTYLGGSGDDIAKDIEVDAQGNAYLTGQTSSEDFPIKSALQPRKLGSRASYDAFLTKLDPSGDPVYSSYLGGGANDDGRAITLDTAGGLYVAGSTDSDDFPKVNPIQGTRNGRFGIGFVTKVVNAADGAALSQARRSR